MAVVVVVVHDQHAGLWELLNSVNVDVELDMTEHHLLIIDVA